ncbi:hypothetical protein DFH06DRAFT_1132397 [Mycena polygramma]|nr:hypothetical protein DFH06DRAFT_1132397 [Mycena polygramma]
MDADVLESLGKLSLPGLYSLMLAYGDLSVTVLGLARDLVALPSLRTLVILQFPSDDVALRLLFSLRTSPLRRLYLNWGPTGKSLSPQSRLIFETPVGSTRVQVGRLELVCPTTDIAGWLLDAHCPLDISHLQELSVFATPLPPLTKVMECARNNINVLCLGSDDVPMGLALASISKIAILQLLGSLRSLATAATLLPMDWPRLRLLELMSPEFYLPEPVTKSVTGSFGIGHRTTYMGMIDFHVARLDAPKLTRLRLAVLNPGRPSGIVPTSTATTGEHYNAALASLILPFIKMRRRRVLCVSDFRVNRPKPSASGLVGILTH